MTKLNTLELLNELSLNSRSTHPSLAKKLNSNKYTIYKQIKSLEDSKVIDKYITSINFETLGYCAKKYYFKLHSYSVKRITDFEEFLLKNQNSANVLRLIGKFDYCTTIFFKQKKELNEFELNIKSNFNDIIQQIEIIHNGETILYPKLSNDIEKRKESFKIKESKQENISSNEIKVLNELKQNPKATLIEIYKKTQITPKSISQIIKKLQEKKIITYFTCNINYEKLGFESYKCHIIFDYTKDPEEFKKKLSTLPQVKIVQTVFGQIDYELTIVINSKESDDEITNFLGEINSFCKSTELYKISRKKKFNPTFKILKT